MDKKSTLLEQAQVLKIKSYRTKVSDEEIELVFAWLKDEITAQRASKVMSKVYTSWNYKAAIILKEAYYQGKIKIVE